MLNDPIGDLLIRIKNAYLAKLATVEIPQSRLKVAILNVLQKHGFVSDSKPGRLPRYVVVKLVYKDGQPALSGVKRISKPGQRRYMNVTQLRQINSQLGFYVLSTPDGIKTHVDAKKAHLGGEIMFLIW